MNPSKAIKESIATFCRLNGIDPDSDAVVEFYVAVLSELSGVANQLPGHAHQYIARHATPKTAH